MGNQYAITVGLVDTLVNNVEPSRQNQAQGGKRDLSQLLTVVRLLLIYLKKYFPGTTKYETEGHIRPRG